MPDDTPDAERILAHDVGSIVLDGLSLHELSALARAQPRLAASIGALEERWLRGCFELCGGTHVANVGCIGGFRVLSDRALAAGVRRIEAVAGEVAAQLARQERALLSELESELKSPADRLLERVQALKTQLKEAKQAKVVAAPDAASVRAGLEGDATFGWSHLADLDAEALRTLSDGLRAQKELPAVVVLTGGDSKKVPFVVLCRPESGHHAGKLAKAFGKHVRGGGGGRPDFAQGQGSQGDGLDAAFTAFRQELGATSA